ncbi:unnamed protein product, partial [Didymodactylos carnosus]
MSKKQGRQYRLVHDTEREIVTTLVNEVGPTPSLIVQRIKNGGFGDLSDYYNRLQSRSSSQRIQSILQSTAQSVSRVRVNDTENFSPLASDTFDYIRYNDNSISYASSRVRQGSLISSSNPDELSSRTTQVLDMYQQQLDSYSRQRFNLSPNMNDGARTPNASPPKTTSTMSPTVQLTYDEMDDDEHRLAIIKPRSKTAISTNDPDQQSNEELNEMATINTQEHATSQHSNEMMYEETQQPLPDSLTQQAAMEYDDDILCLEEISSAPLSSIEVKPSVESLFIKPTIRYSSQDLQALLSAVVYSMSSNTVLNGGVLKPFAYLLEQSFTITTDVKPTPVQNSTFTPLPGRKNNRSNTLPFSIPAISTPSRREDRSRSPLSTTTSSTDQHCRSTISLSSTPHHSRSINQSTYSASDDTRSSLHKTRTSAPRERPATITDVSNFTQQDFDTYAERRRQPPITAQA